MNATTLLLLFLGAMGAGFVAMVIAYTILIRQAWQHPERRTRLKALFLSNKVQPWYDRRAVALIPCGAVLGLVGCLGLLITATTDPTCVPNF